MGQATIGSKPAHIAMLDYDLSDKTSKARHDGFLTGFGVAEGDPQIAGSALNMGNAVTGQTAMENLLSAHPDINVIYTINEPAAQGASFAIEKAKRDVLVTSIDGSCSGCAASPMERSARPSCNSPPEWARWPSKRSSRRSTTA